MLVSYLFLVLLELSIWIAWPSIKSKDRCHNVMNQGHWLKDTLGSAQWQPEDCLLADYDREFALQCLDNHRILFIGDSSCRKVYWALNKLLNSTIQNSEILSSPKHSNLLRFESSLSLEFYWDPYLNSSGLDALESIVDKGPGSPALIFVSVGMWFVRYLPQHEQLLKYKTSLEELFSASRNLPAKSENLMFIAPVFQPYQPLLSLPRKETMTPQAIDKLNNELKSQLEIPFQDGFTDIHVPWIFNELGQSIAENYDQSGVHLVDSLTKLQANVLLNLRCNHQIKSIPSSCCIPSSTPFTDTFIFHSLHALVLVSFLLTLARGKVLATLNLLLKLPIVLAFCYLANHTNAFEVQARTAHWPIVTAFFTGILSFLYRLGWSSSDNRSVSNSIDLIPVRGEHMVFSPKADVPRNISPAVSISEELKGIIVVFLILYNLLNAGRIESLAAVAKTLSTGYVFLLGYQHTSLLVSSDMFYRPKVIATTLLRYNVLSLSLILLVDTPFHVDSVAIISSLWYMIVVGTLLFNRLWKSNKLIPSAIAFCLLSGLIYTLPFSGSSIFGPLILRLQGDAIACFTGIALSIFQTESTTSSKSQILAGLLLFSLYVLSLCNNLFEELSSFISTFAIVGVLLLRKGLNSDSGTHRFSQGLQAFGKLYVELMVLLNFALLAIDGHGRLVIVGAGHLLEGFLSPATAEIAAEVLNVLVVGVIYYLSAENMSQLVTRLVSFV